MSLLEETRGLMPGKARSNWKQPKRQAPVEESIAGVPGAFAVSDAEPPSFEDAKADLLDRVRNPRWEYPSWALPKVALDEEGMGPKWDSAVRAFDKARDYATAAKAMKQMKALAAGEDDSHYANAISHRLSRLRKLKAKQESVELEEAVFDSSTHDYGAGKGWIPMSLSKRSAQWLAKRGGTKSPFGLKIKRNPAGLNAYGTPKEWAKVKVALEADRAEATGREKVWFTKWIRDLLRIGDKVTAP